MSNRLSTKPVFLVCMLASTVAHAHFPLMTCYSENENIVCEAGYSDGSDAVDYDVEMFDYSDNLIGRVKTDARSVAEFKNPDTDFYIVFDAGHESPVEVDVVEIKSR